MAVLCYNCMRHLRPFEHLDAPNIKKFLYPNWVKLEWTVSKKLFCNGSDPYKKSPNTFLK